MTLAEEKKEGEEEQTEEKKGFLKPLLMVVLGAVAGGAGVVFMGPKPPEPEHAPPPPDIRVYDHPTPMEFTVNPVVDRGHKQAMIHFLFAYRADKVDVEGEDHGEGDGGGHGGGHGAAPAEPSADDLPPVLRAIAVNWNRAESRCLEVLSGQHVETLLDPDGKRKLKRALIEELTATLFPGGEATVDDILWKKFFVQ